MKDRHDYHDPEDESLHGPDHHEALLDRWDRLRDEMRDREFEAAVEETEALKPEQP